MMLLPAILTLSFMFLSTTAFMGRSTNVRRCFSSGAYERITTSINSSDDVNSIDETLADSKSLVEFLSPSSSCRVNQMSGTDLAYIGDVVYELFVRSRHVWPSKRTTDLQNTVVGIVNGTLFAR